MTAVSQYDNTLELLAANNLRKALINDLAGLRDLAGLSREQVAVILGQWYHPLHYFPVFLSRLIAVTPRIEIQTQVSRILWQELGAGDSKNAHELIYISTLTDAGFRRDKVAEAAAFESTKRLVEGYRQASEDYLSGLGFLYGTEVMDLQMVSTIGDLMRRCTGKEDLPWVNVHVAQEPGHVESSESSIRPVLTAEEQREVVRGAEAMWELWTDFFKSVQDRIATEN